MDANPSPDSLAKTPPNVKPPHKSEGRPCLNSPYQTLLPLTPRLSSAELNALYPVIGIIELSPDVFEIVRGSTLPNGSNSNKRDPLVIDPETGELVLLSTLKRPPIGYWSKKSRNRLIDYATRLNFEPKTQLTVTYSKMFRGDGLQIKKDLRRILLNLTKRYGYSPLVWRMEFFKSGVPHLHIVSEWDVDRERRGEWAKFWSRRQGKQLDLPKSEIYKCYRQNLRQKVWDKERSPGGLRFYITEHMAKMYQAQAPKDFQNVGRFWGYRGDLQDKKEMVAGTDRFCREFLSAKGIKTEHLPVLPKLTRRVWIS